MPIGLLIWPLGLFVFLAESNATNLTDGLDGLAAGVGAIVLVGLSLQLMLRGNGGDPALAGYAAALAGAWLGFLLHNRHPARVFMGDTGSLAMGAALTAISPFGGFKHPNLQDHRQRFGQQQASHQQQRPQAVAQ